MKKEEIGSKLQEYRVRAGLTQKDVALAIQRPQPTIAAWEKGRSQPDADTLYSLLLLYKVSPNTFFDYDISSINVTSKELELIEMYRSLDTKSQAFILTVLEHEKERCQDAPSQHPPSNKIDSPTKILLKISDQPASAGTGVYLGPDGFTEHMVNAEAVKGADFGVPVSGDSMEPLYKDGDIILVSMSSPVQMGDIALVTMDGCGYVKKLGKGVLISVNHHYDPITVTEDIRINGKVIGVLPAQTE